MRKTLFLILLAVLAISSVFGQTAVVTARPTQIDISAATSESAVLMTISSYANADARYRLYSGSYQYYTWDPATSLYSNTNVYSACPLAPGNATLSITWWIPFQRGSNNATTASYRDRIGPDYPTNYQTVALPTATAITTPVSITNANVTFTTWNTYTQKYVILAYDSAIGGNLISATSTALTTGAFDLKIQDGTSIERIVVVDLHNNIIETVLGTWGASTPTPTISAPASLAAFSATTGTPSAIQSYTLSGSNLTANINVAIPAGYEISTDQSTWLSGLSLASTFNGLVYVRLTGTTAGTYDGNIVHSSTGAANVNTAVTGLVSDPNPEIITIGTLYPFQTMTGLPSPAQSYLITGAYLTTDITVTAPAGFNVSTNGTDYSQFVSVPVSSTSAQVYVRLTGATEGTFSGNVTNVSAPAPQINLAVTGVVSDLLFEENFVYPEADPLTSHGWAVQGVATPVVTVSAPSLTYTDYPSVAGNSVLLATSGQDVNHNFTEQTTGSVYASALVNVSSAQTAGDYFLHFGESTISTNFRARVFIQKASDTEFKFGISYAGNETAATYTTSTYLFNTTYLVVLKYTMLVGDSDTAYLFVDPVFGSGEPAFTLQAPDTSTTELANVGTIALRQGGSTKAAAVRVDGIRVANSWENLWGLQFNSEITLEGGPLEEFTSVVGIPSAAQQYSVRGTDLSTGITVTAPAGFQVSLDGDTGWDVSVIIPAIDGSVDSVIYVRFFPAELLTYDGSINHSSGSATPQTMAVRGVATAPLGVITVNETPLIFDAVSGTPSDAQQISVSGSNLIAPIIVTVEAPFQIKKTTDIIWGLSTELDYNFNGVIDVRFNPTIGGNFNGQVMFASTDATTKYTPLTGAAVQAVATIAELRGQTPGTSTKYALTGQGVITYIRSASRDQIYLQDATAAIVVDDLNHLISNDLLIGDGITNLTGTLALYSNLLQFTPTSPITAASSTGNAVVAEIRTLASLTSSDQAKLVLINNLSFTTTGTFAASQSYPVADASGTGILRTNFSLADGADYIGTAVPVAAQNLTALVGQFNTDIQITPRTLADFDPAEVAPVPTKLVVTTINPETPTVGQPFTVTVQAQDEAGTPLAVNADTVINLTLATGTGTLSGTLSGTMNNLQNTITISGVLYNTAQTGVSITATASTGMTLTAGTSALFEVLAAGVEPVVAHYWNFNTNLPVSPANWAQPIPADMGTGGSLSYDFTTAVTFGGTALNGVSGEVNGGSFCPTGGAVSPGLENNGHYFELAIPTTGYEAIVFSYATRGTATGFSSQEVQYSTDGTNFQTMQTFTGTNVTSFSVKEVDFSAISGANNNPNFKIRVIVSGATSTTGNNRFDNIKVMGLASTSGPLDSPVVTITRDGNNVVLNWNAITGANGGYRIEADTNPYGSFAETYTVASGVLTWSQTSAEKKFYRVVALP